MLNIVIFGAPGSGKGTQSENIIEKYHLAHISTGDVLRAEVKAETELGKHANSFMSKGHLIPDELMIDILASVFDQKTKDGDCKGVIFDGFPRTIPQGVALSEMLEKRNQKIAAVVSLEVSDDYIIDRLVKRGRPDDVEDIIQARLDVYRNQTSPLKELYKEEGILHSVKGTGTVEEIFERISEVIEKVK